MRKHINRLKTAFLLLTSVLVLAACGGGGGGGPLDGGGTTGDGGIDDSAAISGFTIQLLQDGADEDSDITSISDSNPGVVLVQLNGDADAIASQIVNFSTTIGTLSSASALTDSTGRTEVAITAGGDDAAAGTVTASVGGLTDQSVNFEIVSEGTVVTSGFTLNVGLYESGTDLSDLASATEVGFVSTLGSAVFAVQVTDVITGDPVVGAIVSVSTSAGELIPSSGQILTNSEGVAAAEISAGTSDPGAAATLTASIEGVDAGLNFAFGSVDLQIGRDGNSFADPDDIAFVENEIDVSVNGNLSAGGTTVLTVVVVSSDDLSSGFDTPLTVNFSSSCSSAGTASIDTGITTVNGIAQATYTANGCEATDEITATVDELSGISASGSVTIEEASVGSIVFVSADPAEINLFGAGIDTTTLTFQVLDTVGQAAAGETVTAELSSIVGGITIDGESDGNATSITDSEGNVSFTIQAGSVPGSPRVTATVDVAGTEISTLSESLSINTGQPDNSSFSVAASVLSPGGYDIDGVTSDLTVRVADAFENLVDGKNISFITEFGAIQGSCTTDENGSCSVTWNSQDQRAPLFASTGRVLTINELACDTDADGIADLDSAGDPVVAGVPCLTPLVDPLDIDFPGQIYGGRSTILAYADGEESFVDSNGNGIYDWIDTDGDGTYDEGVESLEPFVDLPEAFIDHNNDGVFGNPDTPGACTGVGVGNAIVSVVDINDMDSDGDTDELIGEAVLCANWEEGGAEEEHIDSLAGGTYDRGNGIYNGTLCESSLELAGGCTKTLVTVRDSITLGVGGSTPYGQLYESGVQLANSEFPIDVSGGGSRNLTLVVSDLFNGGLPSGTTAELASESCKLAAPTSYDFSSTGLSGAIAIGISLSDSDAAEPGEQGSVTIEVSNDNATDTFVFQCVE